MNPDATDVHQEGLIIPPSRYNMERDWNGGPFERLIAANIRVPELTIGDFNAQFAANAIGGKRVKQLCARYGAGTIMSVMDSHLTYSERRMRAAIAEIPDGVYHGEDAVDDDGINSKPLPIKAAVTVDGDDIAVDFAGTADQVLLNLNCPFASTVSAALAAVKAVASSPDIPFNQGLAKPITVTAPYGSLLNPKPPAPVRARMIPAFRAFDAVVKALAKAVPDKVIATGFDTTHSICMSGWWTAITASIWKSMAGGYGAGPGSDGSDGSDGPLSNCSNIPVESLDQQYDFFRVTEYALRPDSGGRGKFRGGSGLRRRFEILADDVTLGHYSDRYRIAPDGAFGGEPGDLTRTRIIRGDRGRDPGRLQDQSQAQPWGYPGHRDQRRRWLWRSGGAAGRAPAAGLRVGTGDPAGGARRGIARASNLDARCRIAASDRKRIIRPLEGPGPRRGPALTGQLLGGDRRPAARRRRRFRPGP